MWSLVLFSNTLLHTVTHCNTLQHTATRCTSELTVVGKSGATTVSCVCCNTLQHTATHCYTLQRTATQCNTLRYTAAHCNTLQHTATHRTYEFTYVGNTGATRYHTATHCNNSNALQHTETYLQNRCDTLSCVEFRLSYAQ